MAAIFIRTLIQKNGYFQYPLAGTASQYPAFSIAIMTLFEKHMHINQTLILFFQSNLIEFFSRL